MDAWKIWLSASSNKGNVRSQNEDNYSVNGKSRPNDKINTTSHGIIDSDSLFLLGVFDGMGGEENGDIAANIASLLTKPLMNELNSADPENYDKLVLAI